MTDEQRQQLQQELVRNILDDPNASREAKLVALMGDRQLVLFESILELRQDAERAKTQTKELSDRVSALEERMARIDGRCQECPRNTRSGNVQDERSGDEGS